ncbi:regulatory protein NPR2 [Tripterygium wilfordii]|uniref:Regulatory protein NPR2 n=1 Tax=Tripterygium wilfordii TaxID=458696 RepID=A0A7J7C4V7_TRIWF|nr:regulatory protein NPR2 [Tripterygium wilfordii]
MGLPTIIFGLEMLNLEGISKKQLDSASKFLKRRLLNFVGKALVDDVIPILLVAFHCQSSQLRTQCVDRVARSNLDIISIEKELPYEVVEEIKLIRRNSVSAEQNTEAVDPLHEKRIRKIHKALDSDDVELVKLLLTESDVTLDDANALHYAAAYCDPKIVTEVLSLGLADVNFRNSRGYTVLHVAAMRREPSVIVSLLNKGASAVESTSDGQSAVSICRRLTRPKDYHAKTAQGQEANKDRLCIDVLEREIRRNPLAGDVTIDSQIGDEDLHVKLFYLENRVAFARLFFPAEAKVAMDIANAETTSEFVDLASSKGSRGELREVDLNETPIMRNKRLLTRLIALMKTVETGRRYFPNCSEVLDKFIEDDLPDLFHLEKGTTDEQHIKKSCFMELKDDVQKAFDKDKAEIRRTGLSPSSSSSSLKDGLTKKFRKL